MSQPLIRKALEIALNAMSPALSTAWENVEFQPVAGTPFQEAAILFAEPENPTMGDGMHRENGYMQVTLKYPQNVGTKDVTARAELIRGTFARGNSFTNGGITATITRTPEILAGRVDGDRWAVPIRVRFHSHIFN